MKICNRYNDWRCFTNVSIDIFNEMSETFKACDCLPSCNSINYNYNLFFEDLRNQTDDNVTRSSMSIYFADDEFIVLKRFATFGTVSLLSSIAGMLGLFLGVSVLSIVEVFYFFVIRFINNFLLKE